MRGRVITLAVVAAIGVAALVGCRMDGQVRIENASPYDLTDVFVAGQPFGDIAAGETSAYHDVTFTFRYAAMKMYVDGRYVTAQSLNYGADRFTYVLDVADLEKGHLDIEIVKDTAHTP